MSLAAGASLLSGIGMLGANLAPFVEIGQGHAYQREQMQWARRAYCLDSRALRIDLLNAVKEDVRDHHQTYASRIDTLLVVHTLLLTYALATLQYSNEFLPSSSCTDCEEAENPLLVTVWVYSVSAILILPFWGIVMLIWSKLRLDQWLENSLGRLNTELRTSLAPEPTFLDREEIEMSTGAMRSTGPDPDAQVLLEKVEQAVTRLGGFVVEHQESFKVVWNKETRWMISAATFFLWASCILAILITSGMFWLFLENNMTHKHRHAAWHFATCTACGLCAPGFYVVWYKCCSAREADPPEVFEDCIEPLPSPRRQPQDTSSVPRHRSLRQSAARTLGAIGQWSGRSRNFNDESDAFLRGQTLREAPAVAEFQLQPFSSMPAGAETWQDIDLGHQ